MATPLPMKSAAEILGARLLKDIEREEGSLESVSTNDAVSTSSLALSICNRPPFLSSPPPQNITTPQQLYTNHASKPIAPQRPPRPTPVHPNQNRHPTPRRPNSQ